MQLVSNYKFQSFLRYAVHKSQVINDNYLLSKNKLQQWRQKNQQAYSWAQPVFLEFTIGCFWARLTIRISTTKNQQGYYYEQHTGIFEVVLSVAKMLLGKVNNYNIDYKKSTRLLHKFKQYKIAELSEISRKKRKTIFTLRHGDHTFEHITLSSSMNKSVEIILRPCWPLCVMLLVFHHHIAKVY